MLTVNKNQAITKLNRLIEDGRQHAGQVIEHVINRQPQDYIVKASALQFSGDGGLRMQLDKAEFGVHCFALGQIAEVASVWTKFVDALSGDEWGRALIAHNLNEIFSHRDAKRHLVRTVNGNEVRGFLSDQYRRLDSRPIIEAFVTGVMKLGALPFKGYIAIVACDSGLRPEELLPLLWANVDLLSRPETPNGVLHVRGEGKSPAAIRSVPLTPRAQECLQRRWKAVEAGIRKSPFVFPGGGKTGHIVSVQHPHEQAIKEGEARIVRVLLLAPHVREPLRHGWRGQVRLVQADGPVVADRDGEILHSRPDGARRRRLREVRGVLGARHRRGHRNRLPAVNQRGAVGFRTGFQHVPSRVPRRAFLGARKQKQRGQLDRSQSADLAGINDKIWTSGAIV
jgi:hypothetical protein